LRGENHRDFELACSPWDNADATLPPPAGRPAFQRTAATDRPAETATCIGEEMPRPRIAGLCRQPQIFERVNAGRCSSS
jgi:hypothetical protein